jgi:hypothetical protein
VHGLGLILSSLTCSSQSTALPSSFSLMTICVMVVIDESRCRLSPSPGFRWMRVGSMAPGIEELRSQQGGEPLRVPTAYAKSLTKREYITKEEIRELLGPNDETQQWFCESTVILLPCRFVAFALLFCVPRPKLDPRDCILVLLRLRTAPPVCGRRARDREILGHAS